jgi:hypothetical protein
MTKIVEFDPNLPTLGSGPRMVGKPALDFTQAQRYTRKLRLEVFTHLCHGEKPHCQCPGCTVDYIEFLTLDHVPPDTGKKHRAENNLGTGAARLWLQVKREGYPEGQYQMLCQNCNHAKGHKRAACPLAGKSHTREA